MENEFFHQDERRYEKDRREQTDADHFWHLEKTVSIGHIITTVTVAASVLIWALHMENRVAILEVEISTGVANDGRIEARVISGLEHMEASMIRIESKLDNKADKK